MVLTPRVVADGKHLSLDARPFRVRGATYGSFVPRLDGLPFPEPTQIKFDLFAIAAAGLNTVRTYTLPPPELVDVAEDLGLHLLVGVHYRDWRSEAPSRAARRRILDAGRGAIDAAMERCAGRASVLAIAVGNEVPADVVRVHGIGAVEETLSALVRDVHTSDPGMLATYCNFPSTEYLRVEDIDVACFNVFLEQPEALRRYLRHLQVVAHEVPLVITELGLASQVHGETAQAESLRWQLQAVDEVGCAGATVFSWTDEWGVGGVPVEGWGFGVTDSERRPKPAMEVLSDWARSTVADLRQHWPSITVVVCAYNEERMIEECLTSLEQCDYPELEVIVCDDGSQDRTLELARRSPFKVLRLPHGGLSAARNAGLSAATGEIVAYLDADAACHPHWPYYLALSLEDDQVMATGGPNLPVPDAGLVERAVAMSPGGPVHVLVGDDRAEHVPGCNMAFRKSALEEIGGFDPVYTSAGDDVDVCWTLTDAGHEIGFATAAQVRHHRRSTIRGYLRQQRGYGRAERILSGAHRHRFNRLGQARWRGSIYTASGTLRSMLRPIVYHGWLGSAPFQPVSRRPTQALMDVSSSVLPLAAPVIAGGAAFGLLFPPAGFIAAAAAALVALYAVTAASIVTVDRHEPRPRTLRWLVGFLHVAQPVVRFAGRLRSEPIPRQRDRPPLTIDRLVWLEHLTRELASRGCRVRPGRPFDSWDLEITVGPIARGRFSAAVVWQWTLLHVCRVKPRPSALTGLVGVTGLAAFAGTTVALFVATLGAAAFFAESAVLRARLTSALATTGFGSSEEGEPSGTVPE